MTVETSELPTAGTTAQVTITVYGDKGNSGPIPLGYGDGETFKAGDVDVFNDVSITFIYFNLCLFKFCGIWDRFWLVFCFSSVGFCDRFWPVFIPVLGESDRFWPVFIPVLGDSVIDFDLCLFQFWGDSVIDFDLCLFQFWGDSGIDFDLCLFQFWAIWDIFWPLFIPVLGDSVIDFDVCSSSGESGTDFDLCLVWSLENLVYTYQQ